MRLIRSLCVLALCGVLAGCQCGDPNQNPTGSKSSISLAPGPKNPLDGSEPAGIHDLPLLQLRLSVVGEDPVEFESIKLALQGDADVLQGATLAIDSNDDGALGPEDSRLGTLTGPLTGALTFGDLHATLTPGTRSLLLAVDVANSARSGAVISAAITSGDSLTATQGGAAVTTTLPSGSVINGGRKTISVNPTLLAAPGSQNPLSSTCLPSQVNLPVLQFDLSMPSSSTEGAKVTEVSLALSGTVDDAVAVTRIRLYRDTNTNGVVDTAQDVALGAIDLPRNDATVKFESLSELLAAGASASFLAVVDLSGAGATGQTLSVGLASGGVKAVGARTGANLEVSGTPVAGPTKTIDSGGGLFVSAGLMNPSFSTEAVGAIGVPMLQLSMRASASQPVRVNQLTLRASGFGDDATAYSRIRLVLDMNGDGAADANELAIGGSATIASNDGTATFSNLAQVVPAGATQNWLLVVDFSTVVLPTESYALALSTNAGVVAVDPSSSAPLQVSGAPVFGGLKTISSQGSATIALGVNTPGASNEGATATGVPVLQFSVTASSVEAIRISAITLRASGSVDDSTGVAGVHLYKDDDEDGLVTTPGDTLLGSQNFAADNGTVTFTGLTEAISAGAREHFLVTCDLTGTAQPGQTFAVAVSMSSAIVVRGVSSGSSIVPGGTAGGSAKTVQALGSLTIASGFNSPGPTNQNSGATSVPMLQFSLAASTVEAVTVPSITIRAGGTGQDATGVSSVDLYRDVNADGLLDASDVTLGTGSTYNADNGTVTFGSLSEVIPAGQRLHYLVLQSFTASATPGQSFSASVATGTAITASGASSGATITPGGNATGNTVTIQTAGVTLAVEQQNPAASSEFSNAQRLPMLQVRVTASVTEGVRLTRLVATAGGSANDSVDVTGVRLYRDVDASGTVTTGDVQLGSTGTFSVDNGTVQFTGLTETVAAGTSEALLLTYDLGSTALSGQTFDLRIANNTAVTAIGVTSMASAAVAGAPIQGGSKTMKGAALTLATGLANPGAGTELANAQDVAMLQLRLSAGAADGVKITGLTLNGTGSLDETTGLSGVRLYRDVDTNGRVSASDVLIGGPVTFSADNGTASFGGLSEVIPANGVVHWVVQYRLTSEALPGQTFDVRVTSAASVLVESATTAQAATVTGAGITSSTRTVRAPALVVALGAATPTAASHAPNETGLPTLQVKLTGDATEPLALSALTVTASGSIQDVTDVAELRLYLDADADGTVSSGDSQLGVSRTFSGDNGTATFGGLAQPIAAGASLHALVVLDLSGAAAANGTFDSRIAAATSVVAVSTRSGQAATVTGAPVVGNTQTVATQFNTWTPITRTGAPRARANHVAVADSSRMYVFGGQDQSGELNDGAIYTPSTNSWTAMSATGAPSARVGHVAAIAGNYLVVFGGRTGGTYLGDGARFNLTTRLWESMSSTNAPSARSNATIVSTGSSVIVWGGFNGGSLSTGATYDPVADSWTALPALNAPSGRYLHAAVWTGTSMVVWGGFNGAYLADGARFTPGTGLWAATSSAAAAGLVSAASHSATWTGSEMLVWGGFRGTGYVNNCAAYNPGADSWRAMASGGAPGTRAQHVAGYAASRLVIWGGYGGAAPLDTGGQLDPFFNQWIATAQSGAPTGRFGHSAVVIDGKLVVWGGQTATSFLDTGARYTP